MSDGIVMALPLSRADVNAHPHAQGASLAPSFGWLMMECSLRGNCRPQRLFRGAEGGLDGVANDLKDMAAMRFRRLAHKGVVMGEGVAHGCGQRCPQRCAVLDVGEEKGNGSCWMVRHRASP